ncbi:uncharacterized protein LOC141702266 [Apium graveolens]|uniref:uncharacterized protein LOC141702266 n=1 Tax=Apium graveolens TaxID=4045 RepID=UPI003D79EE5E
MAGAIRLEENSHLFVAPSDLNFRGDQGGGTVGKGRVRVSWKNICVPLSEGGLGLKDSTDWNRAQLLLHLCRVVDRHPSLWATWINCTALKNKFFWTMKIPSDCSWIWRKVLKLRNVDLIFVLGNGLNTSFWFDPWWHHTPLTSHKHDIALSQLGLPWDFKVGKLFETGSWVLPTANPRLRHISPVISMWLRTFDFPHFDISKNDPISCSDTSIRKLKVWHIWDIIRYRSLEAPWHHLVWHKLRVLRGVESHDHMFVSCPYTAFILRGIAKCLGVNWISGTWFDLLSQCDNIQGSYVRAIFLLAVQVVTYHIWRERNARAHNKGSFSPCMLLTGILADIRARICSSKFMNIDCIGAFCNSLA